MGLMLMWLYYTAWNGYLQTAVVFSFGKMTVLSYVNDQKCMLVTL